MPLWNEWYARHLLTEDVSLSGGDQGAQYSHPFPKKGMHHGVILDVPYYRWCLLGLPDRFSLPWLSYYRDIGVELC